MGQVIAPWALLAPSPLDPRLRRRQRQRDGLATIRALPAHHQSRALWERWPQRVPKAVWRELTGCERKGWQVAARLAILMRRFAHWPVHDPAEVRQRLHELAHLARVMHGSVIERILAPVTTHVGSQHLIVYFSVYGLMGPFNQKMATFVTTADIDADGNWGDHREPTLNALALGLLHGGTVIVRQELSLRAERLTDQGQWAWVPQERVMGATLCDPLVGEWYPQPAQLIREASLCDPQTGKSRKPEPQWSFASWPKGGPSR